MSFKFFVISVRDDGSSAEELNSFLQVASGLVGGPAMGRSGAWILSGQFVWITMLADQTVDPGTRDLEARTIKIFSAQKISVTTLYFLTVTRCTFQPAFTYLDLLEFWRFPFGLVSKPRKTLKHQSCKKGCLAKRQKKLDSYMH